MLLIDPEIAHQDLITAREERDRDAPDEIAIYNSKKRSKITDSKHPMLKAAQHAINALRGYWPLTVRQVHYRLLNDPPLRHKKKANSTYRNDALSYSDLTDLLCRARLNGDIQWNAISDETRPVSGLNKFVDAASFVEQETSWFLQGYRRDLMQSQYDHVELIAEKMTVQSIVRPIAHRYSIPLTIGRGYCSLEPRHQISQRFRASGKDRLILVIVSDLDPDGDGIAESFARSIRDDFGIENVKAYKALLTKEQVTEWKLPPNEMEAKKTSSRYKAYRQKYGSDAVFELEAVEPQKIQSAIAETIESLIDLKAFNQEVAKEKQDAVKLASIKSEVANQLAGCDLGGDDE